MEHKQDYIITSPFDACANNENDLERLYAMAPEWAFEVNFVTGNYRHHTNPLSNSVNWVKIPDRDRELNRLVDCYSNWHGAKMQLNTDVDGITEEEWRARRALRHPESVNDQPYQSWGEVPEDLKWLVFEFGECLGYCQKTLCGYVNTSTPDGGVSIEKHSGANQVYTRAQWKCARRLAPYWEIASRMVADVNDTDTVDTVSQWMPEVGDEFEFSMNGVSWEERIMLFNDSVSLLMANKKYPANRWHYKANEESMMFRPIDQQAKVEQAEIDMIAARFEQCDVNVSDLQLKVFGEYVFERLGLKERK